MPMLYFFPYYPFEEPHEIPLGVVQINYKESHEINSKPVADSDTYNIIKCRGMLLIAV